MSIDIQDILKRYRCFVMLGQGGSGKSELSLHIATYFPEGGKFLDLDQTKAVFRSRTYAKDFPMFEVISGFSFLDSPTVPASLKDLIQSEDTVIIDMPADQKGLTALGQVRTELANSNACIFLLFNPYRGFDREKRLKTHIKAVKQFLKGVDTYIICNPTLGLLTTTAEDVIQGRHMVEEMLNVMNIELAFTLVDENLHLTGEGYLPITVHFNDEV